MNWGGFTAYLLVAASCTQVHMSLSLHCILTLSPSFFYFYFFLFFFCQELGGDYVAGRERENKNLFYP